MDNVANKINTFKEHKGKFQTFKNPQSETGTAFNFAERKRHWVQGNETSRWVIENANI
jgi:hypothetical protein